MNTYPPNHGNPASHGNNGTPNGSFSGAVEMNASAQRYSTGRVKVLTVDEALPLTPITSVVPFNSDIVPMPKVGLRSSVSIYSTPAERARGRDVLESLNREAADPRNTSRRLQQSLEDLKGLLKPDGLTQFKFKTAPKLSSGPDMNEQPKMKLSPFAQKVLNQTSVNFTHYVAQPLPGAQPVNDRVSHKSASKARGPHLQQSPANVEAFDHNAGISAQLPRTQNKSQVGTTPQPSSNATKSDSSFAVVIPSLPNKFRPQEYTTSKDLPKPATKYSSLSRTSSQASVPAPRPSPTQGEAKPINKPPAHTPSHTTGQPAPPAQTSSSKFVIEIPVQPHHLQHQSQLTPQAHPETPRQIIHELTPTPSGQPLSNPSLAVVIPDLPATFNPGEYDVVPDSPDTPQHLSRKRKRSEIDGYEDGLPMSIGQREKADTAANNLRHYLQEIFEAEDRLQSDGASSNHFFVATSEGYSLTSAAQYKVESLLQKIISMGRFAQAPLDELLRLQKLSESSLKDAESLDIKVDDTMGQAEVDAWLVQIANAELGLKAARTSLRLMSGGREDKQLYSEDVIQSALNAFKNVMDNCIVPIVEMRSSGASAATFKLLSNEKKVINNLLTQCRRVLSLLAALVANVDLSETVINTLEFTASQLIFVENAPVERDSILGIAKFDSLRVVAMDALAQIFLCNPAQRQGIFDEILTSLEKLPVTKQSARQFKLAEGGNIQLVSALIMRLVQTSANKPDDAKEKRRRKALEALHGDEDNHTAASQGISNFTVKSESRAEQEIVTAVNELGELVSPLLETAKQNAIYVVNFIVNRAMKSTKSGDAPYRNLLDLFVEDFITCLNSTDWPAAELLLRLFLFKMVQLAEGDKTPAPARNMALDLLGLMGAAISELNSHIRKTANAIDSGSELAVYLSRLAQASLEKNAGPTDVVSWVCGPFRVSLEYLENRSSSEPQLQGAIGFFMARWAEKTVSTYEEIPEDDRSYQQVEKDHGKLAYRLRKMLTDSRWLSTEYSFETVSEPHAKLAYSLTLLSSPFCESFSRVLTILLSSMTSEQATVRSKSLKSVNQVLDTDPTILDREPAVKHLILRCSNDLSVQVRDSALTLVGKCISLRPALEEELIPSILARVNDSGVGVRKRAMKLSKDIYLRNQKRDIRSHIADSLLHRVTDLDEGVQELARQTIEEVWMSPFYQSTQSDDSSAKFKLAMADHVALMVRTVQRGSGVATVLDKVLQNMLSSDSKSSAANFRVCKALVATMFETIIDNSADGSDAPSARDALHVLMIFAKSNAKLFTPEQIQLLQPYVANVGAGDEMAIFRSVLVIFRHVLPHLSKAHNKFLFAVRKELLPTMARIHKAILDDLVACLWIISNVLEDIQNLTSAVLSSLMNIDAMKKMDLNDPKNEKAITKIGRLILIVGTMGKHCDFDPKLQLFQSKFTSLKGDSVSKLMVDVLAPFASPSQPLEVRKVALGAIGMVCQSWPKNFSSAKIYTAFQGVFGEKNTILEGIILSAFKDFLLLEEKRSEAGNEGLPGTAGDPKAKLGVMGGSQGDGIAIGIAQRFLPDIIRISLATKDDQALLATEVVASIARQGLVHPKECGSTLIALETSPNLKIAELAFKEHRALHEKHETILEKEYMRAVQRAYEYQRDVVEDTHGVTLDPFASKLHLMIDVLKISKVKNRKKFLENLCSRTDFDPAKIKIETAPYHLDFSQFIIENLAFFEYASVDELLATINSMEKVVAATGTGIAHMIETEIFHVSLDQPTQVDENGQQQVMQHKVDTDRLRLLTGSSMMLASLWGARTFLRRLYGLTTQRRESKGKPAPKDLSKAPVKVPFVTGDKFWDETTMIMNSMESEKTMMQQCRNFVQLLNVDQDFKVAAEGDEEAERGRPSTPNEDEDEDAPSTPNGSGRGRKRKSTGTPGGRKKRARSSSVPKGRSRPKGSGNKRASAEKSDDEMDWR
ncbi:hypothetical protein HYALB_00007703 [Hymenoscyphus albidus]|uniref:Sister chromatid cohesion protein n=1 Tax=Hymenoscyphus albidus TaxID=595503 RepID=A0A9N9PSP8_9HELO|nr:hypothetical protein HYALB_00007703 [Hymenoscyphus albidus]